MAKDRFSKFKKSNYNSEFKYGNNSMNYNIIPNREDLTNEQKEWIIKLIKRLKKENDKKFLRSVLEQGKVPTKVQKKIIQSMVNKQKQNEQKASS